MKTLFPLALAALISIAFAFHALGQEINHLALREEDPTLTGLGVVVGQAEAGAPNYQVNPAAVGQPESKFTWWRAVSASTFPNALVLESIHADIVGQHFYGSTTGIAPSVGHIHNYEADSFYDLRIVTHLPIDAAIVNQSFIYDDASSFAQVESNYDDYASRFNTLFVSGLGNGGGPFPPATSYNGLAVSAPAGTTSVGPTTHGRSKPDMSAPGDFTSYATPLVAGAAAVLLQAASRGDGGAGTAAQTTNSMTLKALLLNGALKPAAWTNTSSAPLDPRYGAGWVNLYNSYRHLRGGRAIPIEKRIDNGSPVHPPGLDTNNAIVLQGWDFNTVTSTMLGDGVNHYYFELLTNTTTLNATLVWNRHEGATNLNNLDLFLLRVSDSGIVGVSSSAVDNVEHIFKTGLPPGRYDLQVVKRGGSGARVSNGETYALAFHWAPETLTLIRNGAQLQLSWPISAAGFVVESAPTAGPANAWGSNNVSPTLAGGRYRLDIIPGVARFYRLRR